MTASFIKYGNLNYETLGIDTSIDEIGYPFNVFGKDKRCSPKRNYSLHTEYSAAILTSATIEALKSNGFNTLATALNTSGKSSLWKSEEWTVEFISFIQHIIQNNLSGVQPTIIEIHPPYTLNSNYEVTLENFFAFYALFENAMQSSYTDIKILIENRNTMGNFLLSKSSDYVAFQTEIIKRKLNLKLIVDIPQLYGKMVRTYKKQTPSQLIQTMFNDLLLCTDSIGGFHVCGKGHVGDFNDLFGANKELFLTNLANLTDKINHEVFIVPEIMSQKDFKSIIGDLSFI